MIILISEMKRLTHTREVMCAKPQHKILEERLRFPVSVFCFPSSVGSAAPSKNEQGGERLAENCEKEWL